MMPKGMSALTPTTNSTPMLMSRATGNQEAKATAPKEVIAAVMEMIGAIQKMNRSAFSGIKSSLKTSFSASATGCSKRSETCNGTGASGFAGEISEAPAADGDGREPETSG